MKKLFEQFPITGAMCCSALSKVSHPSDLWILKSIETMSNDDMGKFSDIWLAVEQKKTIEITTEYLCNALTKVTQVIDLDIESIESPSKKLFIEDGSLIECNFI